MTHQFIPVFCVLTYAEFDSERNHKTLRSSLLRSIIPEMCGKNSYMKGVLLQLMRDFPAKS